MIPIKDNNPRSAFPYMTLCLIIVNVIVYLYQVTLPPQDAQAFVNLYGAVPGYISVGRQLHSIFTSMFLHGGILHLAGNMLYLYIFGDNIENVVGHLRFLGFYLICGLFAFTGQFILAPFSQIPMVGASGAISGILGAYALTFPGARVLVLVPIFFFIRIVAIPAAIVLGIWFIIQIYSGLSISSSSGGVAWFAHIGGFIAGLVLIRLFKKRRYRVQY